MKKNKLKSRLVILISLFLIFYSILRFSPYPQLKEFLQHDYSCCFYDKDGQLLQISSVEGGLRREWIDIEDIPQNVKKALLTSEDKRFYFHNGVDFLSVLHSLFIDISSHKAVRGASTITMQTVKMISPHQTTSIKAKIADAFNAYRLESRFSKKEILELYLNNVPFGQNTQGIASASRRFFSKDCTELLPEEISLLVIMLPNPSFYDMTKNPEVASKKAFTLYKKTFSPAKTESAEISNRISQIAAESTLYSYPFESPHLIQYVKNQYKTLPHEIHLSVDKKIQNMAESILLQTFRNTYEKRINNASLLLINNEDASVLAWIGNVNYFDFNNSGQIDGVTQKNQAGSSMKPFLYALAMEKDEDGKRFIKPNSVLPDIPLSFGNENIYIPQNFNNRYNGPIRTRVSLASSLNIPSVYLLHEKGVPTYLNRLFDLGFNSLKEGGVEADLGLALGAGEVTLSELVPAFSVFSRDGMYIPLSYIKDKNFKEKESQVYEKDIARIICSFLSEKNARALGFGYSQTFATEYPSIFKTGTSNQYQNIIALGGTKDWTIGVWMGNFSGNTVIGQTGSSLPALCAKKILDNLTKSKYKDFSFAPSFDEPQNWTKKEICSVSGMLASKNCNSTVFEYIENGDSQEACTWHDDEGRITYPSEFQQWIRINNIEGEIDYSSARLQILTPQNDSVFYYDEINKEYQAVPFEVIGGQDEFLQVYVDGNFYSEETRPFHFYLPMERGAHCVKLINGNDEIKIDFSVE